MPNTKRPYIVPPEKARILNFMLDTCNGFRQLLTLVTEKLYDDKISGGFVLLSSSLFRQTMNNTDVF